MWQGFVWIKVSIFNQKREDVDLKHVKNSKAFRKYSNDFNDAYISIQEYDSRKKKTDLILFDDMNADLISNKNLQPAGTELFIKGRN